MGRESKAKKKIDKAFTDLVCEEGFSSITATDIIRRAGVNRKTFYTHYQDKYDLLDRVLAQQFAMLRSAESVYEIQINTNGSSFFRMGVDSILPVANHFYENGRFYAALWKDDFTSAVLTRLLQENSAELWKINGMDSMLGIPMDYALAGLIGISNALLLKWIERSFAETPYGFSGIFLKAIDACVSSIFSSTSPPVTPDL